jgi:hypothetical protein
MGRRSGGRLFLVPATSCARTAASRRSTRAHPHGQHEGGLVVVSEKSLDKNGNIFAAIIEGPNKGVFTVKRNGEFDITDGAFLPDGDLLLLERSFSMADGVAMRLRRIYGESIAKGAVADGPVLLRPTWATRSTTWKAMDVWQRADGALMVSLMSDDNHSILQRNLYLEFHRGNGAHPDSLVIAVDLPEFFKGAIAGKKIFPPVHSTQPLPIGDIGGVPLSVTDAALLPDGGLIVTAVGEDTSNAYDDGKLVGAVVCRLGPNLNLTGRWTLDPVVKVEGIALDGGDILLVTDADDPSRPAELFRAKLPEV